MIVIVIPINNLHDSRASPVSYGTRREAGQKSPELLIRSMQMFHESVPGSGKRRERKGENERKGKEIKDKVDPLIRRCNLFFMRRNLMRLA